jgi:hypothetical protein
VGTIDSGAVVTPACSVYNYGSSTENYSVRMRIGAGYNQTASVSNHLSGTRVYVTFPSWTASPVGPTAVTCSTELTGDQVLSDDRQTGGVTVQALPYHDVGCTHILVPVGTIDSNTSVAPACSVHNFGNRTESYPVRIKIGTSYNQTALVTSQSPGTRTYVTFPSYSAWPRGNQAVTCSTELSGDMATGNDRQTGSVNVRVLDVAATSIDVPGDSIVLDDSVQPIAQVANFGTDNATFQVVMKIGSWTQSRGKTLAPAAQDTAGFPYWIAQPLGMQAMKCSTWLVGDVVPTNNSKRDSVMVWVPTGVSQGGPVLPAVFALHPARPNPAEDRTVISFDLPSPARTEVAIYDVHGRLIRELLAMAQPAGRYRLVWNRLDDYGRRVAPGVYFCRLRAGEHQATAKLLLVD